MGRCSGLKGGGHQRKAIDVANRKKAEKAAGREAKASAGARAATLQKLLALDPDCDVYLLATDAGATDADGGDTNDDNAQAAHTVRPLCRAYFRHDRCANRRCKFSHDHSIADALVRGGAGTGTSSGGRTATREEDNGEGASVPALELIPGLLVGARPAAPGRRKRPVGPPVTGAAGALEDVPASAVQTIAAFCRADADVANVAGACRHLRLCLLDCPDVRRRERSATEVRLRDRNDRLQVRATAGRLRFAVSYMDATAAAAEAAKISRMHGKRRADKGKGGKKGRGATAVRPTLAYDFENPHVFQAFETSRRESDSDGLSSALAASNVHES